MQLHLGLSQKVFLAVDSVHLQTLLDLLSQPPLHLPVLQVLHGIGPAGREADFGVPGPGETDFLADCHVLSVDLATGQHILGYLDIYQVGHPLGVATGREGRQEEREKPEHLLL